MTADMSTGHDPVTLEVLKHALASIADEMALVVLRSAYSPVVRDTMDYSTALMDANGRVVAQGLTLAVQLGSFPDVMRHLMADFDNDMAPGDVFACNDPYGAGGQHLPDIYVIQPVFMEGRRVGFAATIAHHCDIGGIAPGSVAIHATEVFQEGLRLPIVKLHDAGRAVDALFRILEKNSRNPVHLIGDIRAQIAACRAGARGLSDLVARHGAERFATLLDALQDQAEQLMRHAIAQIPDGSWSFEDWIDGLGEAPEPVRIAVRVTVAGDRLSIDFSGTSEQVAGAINAPVAMARSASYCAVRCLADADIPNCEGYMRAVEIHVPDGSVLNPRLPAACGARGVMGYRAFDAIMGALAQAVPDRVIAACEGGADTVLCRRLARGAAVDPNRGDGGRLGSAGGPGWPRGGVAPLGQLVEPAGRADRSGISNRDRPLWLRYRLRRAGAPARGGSLRARIPSSVGRGDLHHTLGPARASALRASWRGAGCGVVQRTADRRWFYHEPADDADAELHDARRRLLSAHLRRRRRLWPRHRARARSRGGGRSGWTGQPGWRRPRLSRGLGPGDWESRLGRDANPAQHDQRRRTCRLTS